MDSASASLLGGAIALGIAVAEVAKGVVSRWMPDKRGDNADDQRTEILARLDHLQHDVTAIKQELAVLKDRSGRGT